MTNTMTIEQILAEEMAAQETFEADTEYKGFKVAELRKVMGRIQNQSDWKSEWAAAVPHQLVGAVMAAVNYFHGSSAVVVGAEAITGKVLMRGNGYAC